MEVRCSKSLLSKGFKVNLTIMNEASRKQRPFLDRLASAFRVHAATAREDSDSRYDYVMEQKIKSCPSTLCLASITKPNACQWTTTGQVMASLQRSRPAIQTS